MAYTSSDGIPTLAQIKKLGIDKVPGVVELLAKHGVTEWSRVPPFQSSPSRPHQFQRLGDLGASHLLALAMPTWTCGRAPLSKRGAVAC